MLHVKEATCVAGKMLERHGKWCVRTCTASLSPAPSNPLWL